MDDPTNERASGRTIRRVTLAGASTAGTSLALAWKAARPDVTVTGFGAPAELDAAEQTGAVDRKAASPEAAADGADLVVLAGRLPAALRRLEALAPHLSPGTLVTDTGAVKQPIARHATAVLPESVDFIGGHPVPSGDPASNPATDAGASYFDGGTYFLCPPGETSGIGALRTHRPDFLALVETTGAEGHVLSAAHHDRLAATARDLPELLAATLAHVVSEEGDHEALHALAPPAVRSQVWGRTAPGAEQREELTGNEGAALDALGRYVRALQQTRRHLAAGDLDAALGASPSRA